ncbi:uncharacterized protein [Henckelia pumila]|uniref:uncharacterized protein isoform X5 n=1 Tax=Henckelia pumila TaxID=405737 RepID=UPI003C6E5E93
MARPLHPKHLDICQSSSSSFKGQEAPTKTANKTMRKLIFIDEHGTMIHGLIFDNVNENFHNLLETNKTHRTQICKCQPQVRVVFAKEYHSCRAASATKVATANI